MTSSIIAHLHFGGADVSFRRKSRLLLTLALVVLLLGCVKVSEYYFGLELLELNTGSLVLLLASRAFPWFESYHATFLSL